MTDDRTIATTQKIGQDVTGLKGAVYVHVDRAEDGRVVRVRFSHKQKDNSTLDNLLIALGNTVTALVTELAE